MEETSHWRISVIFVAKYIKLVQKFICVFLYIFLLNWGPNTGNCLSPERSEIIGKSRDYNDYSVLWLFNTIFLNISYCLPHFELRNNYILIVVITNFVVISNVSIKRADCTGCLTVTTSSLEWRQVQILLKVLRIKGTVWSGSTMFAILLQYIRHVGLISAKCNK